MSPEAAVYPYSCRLTKTPSHLLRQISSLTIIECAFDVLQVYHEENGTFELKQTTIKEFIEKLKLLIDINYGNKINNALSTTITPMSKCNSDEFLMVNTSVVNASIYFIEKNLEQYKLLFNTERKPNAAQKPSTITEANSQTSSSMTSQASNEERMARVYREILLFDSVVFTTTHLYQEPYLKRNNNYLEQALNQLIINGLLLVYPLGGHNGVKSVKLYIKQLPSENETISEIIDFEKKLHEYSVNYSSFKQACTRLNFFSEKIKIKQELYRKITSGLYSKVIQQDMSEFKQEQWNAIASKGLKNHQ
ncbi:unnamed protein product [Didymodactylos carnosus]|uniref:Uncharacterized protein n=1 Tax=Didymodactylos carnosus TaxID=1234261 RepID=A0A814VUT0_9BILA|nr:unnamed protein product [Didymodactylos carnosus]CAF3957336.1 unnamed protein product [Didymodactylos carnosus]